MKPLPGILLTFCISIPGWAEDKAAAPRAGKAEHVVMIVWDGMRPDFVADQYTPALAKLAREGVTFARHHSAYVTSTEVNATVLATGVYPNRSGIMANREYRPELNVFKPVDTQAVTSVRTGDELARGRYIGVQTVAEILHAAGRRTVIAGTKQVAILHDRSAKRDEGALRNSVNLFQGATLPDAALKPLIGAFGPFPPQGHFPNAKEDEWTTRALIESLWKDDVPKFSVLWLSEPDFSQHQAGPGSPTALGALKSSDQNLARVLRALDAKGVRDKTDVLVVSDHGFSTVSRQIDLAQILADAGFKATRIFTEEPQPGEIMAVTDGATSLIYVIGHDAALVRKLVEFLQMSDFTGLIATREAMPGTFTLDRLRINTPGAPDIVLALRWSDKKSDFGVPGMVVSDLGKKPGQGMHATVSPFELHNTLIAIGPDFRKGWTDNLPTGNVDIAPTILAILGVKAPEPMDGRVLSEAMAGETPPSAKPEEQRVETSCPLGNSKWRQYLKFTKFAGATYLEEGAGELVGK
jgi:arylsulfatase A-like enzyme